MGKMIFSTPLHYLLIFQKNKIFSSSAALFTILLFFFEGMDKHFAFRSETQRHIAPQPAAGADI